MKARALLAVTAVLLWAAAWLLPEQIGDGRDWWLLDVSASMAGTTPPAEAQQSPDRVRYFARSLTRSADAERGWEASALGAALLALRADLRPGDRLHVFTDGRSSDALPPRALFDDCQITGVAPPPGPRLLEIRAPPAWPASGELILEARLLDANLSQAALSVEAPHDGVDLLRALQAGPDLVRLELRARDPLHPPQWLRVHWREGERGTVRAVALAGPSTAPLTVVDPARWGASEEEWLRAGGTILLASGELSAWMNLPAACRIFQPAIAARPLTILLDRSGSMDQGGLDEARALLERWADAFSPGGILRVQAFAERLEAPLDLRQPPDRARLAGLLPFGPTRLAEALEEACAGLPADATMLLISDGRAEPPAQGWASWRASVIGGRRLLCIPVGADFDLNTLSTLGEPITAGLFAERLGSAFDQALAEERGEAFAAPGASLPLPERLHLRDARSLLDAAPGAELLMQDGAGRAVLALRRVGGGAVLGFAGSAAAGWPAELQAAAQASRQPVGGWSAGVLSVVAGPPPPRVQQGGRQLDLLLLDPGPPARWQVLAADPREPVAVGDATAGRAWLQPPAADLEWSAEPAAWLAWLDAGAERRNRGGPRPTLLMAALAAASLTFFLAHRARA